MNLDPFYKNPADSAMPYLEKIPGTITPYYQPYIDAGGDALNTLIQQYTRLINNPGSVISSAGAGYQQSPGYQYNYNSGVNAADAAAAAGGTLGTPEHQQETASMAEDLADQDFQTYLQQALGLYSKGLSGEEGLNKMGYGASNTLATELGSNLSQEANLAYEGTANSNAANASFMKLLSQALGAGIGGITGGMKGALEGSALLGSNPAALALMAGA